MMITAILALTIGSEVASVGSTRAPTTRAPEAVNQARFELGQGLRFRFDEGRHSIALGGFIQPFIGLDARNGDSDPDLFLNSRRSHLYLEGSFFDGRIDYFFQGDFSRTAPLLDAWLGYNAGSWLSVSIGQRQNLSQNREMLHMESQLSFVDRSLLSRTFSESGRELGAFVVASIELGPMLIRPQGSATSGDGRNSFGVDSRDRDLGGLKWGGRLDVLPFGDFSPGNRRGVVDLVHEPRLKIVVGAAGSYNDGASHEKGAGHGDFALFNADGALQLPDYVQLYADLLAKYRGFSLLVEGANATATSLQGSFTNEAGTTPLFATEISDLLVLGNAFNAQIGYFFGFGLGVDVRYTRLFGEFDDRPSALLLDTTGYGAGAALYLMEQAFKAQFNYERVERRGAEPLNRVALLIQVII
ncbi:MAG: hypothetical protein AAFZ18_28670 [Myxococcota bacterium]